MQDYILYYWPAPFRGNFIELLLNEKKCNYQRQGPEIIYPERVLEVKHPGMAPPYIYDKKEKKHFSQMPASMMYLAEKHQLMPKNLEKRYLALKLICDSNDVLLEITNCYGKKMWSKEDWKKFRNERLKTWLHIFEKTAKQQGLKKTKGFVLGDQLSVADLALTALLGTIAHSFPDLEKDLKESAPNVTALCFRIENRPQIAAFLKNQRKDWGRVYCGGKIEKSLRKVLKT